MSSGIPLSEPFGDAPPPADGYADFLPVWESDEEEFDVSEAADLPNGFAEAFGIRSFAGFAEIDHFFKQKKGASSSLG